MTNLSTLTTTSPADWTDLYGNATFAGDTATLGVGTFPSGATSDLTSHSYDFDSVTVQLTVPAGSVGQILVKQIAGSSGLHFARFQINRAGSGVSTWAYVGATGGSYRSGTFAYDPTAHAYLRLRKVNNPGGLAGIEFAASPDGTTWTQFFGPSAETVDLAMGPVKLNLFGICTARLVPAETPTPDVPDWFDPTPDPAPAEDTSGCSTILDLIREFSAAVRRAVRITGPRSIAMVDPNEPLPTGWRYRPDEAPDMFSTHSRQYTAGATVLTLNAGALALTGDGGFQTDDIRLLASDWRIPQRLPVYGGDLAPAAVSSCTMTFTPAAHTCAVTYQFPTTPGA